MSASSTSIGRMDIQTSAGCRARTVVRLQRAHRARITHTWKVSHCDQRILWGKKNSENKRKDIVPQLQVVRGGRPCTESSRELEGQRLLLQLRDAVTRQRSRSDKPIVSTTWTRNYRSRSPNCTFRHWLVRQALGVVGHRALPSE